MDEAPRPAPRPSERADAGLAPRTDAAVEVGREGGRCTGDWTLLHLAEVEAWLASGTGPGLARRGGDRAADGLVLDCASIRSLDTAGAWLLRRLVTAMEGAGQSVSLAG